MAQDVLHQIRTTESDAFRADEIGVVATNYHLVANVAVMHTQLTALAATIQNPALRSAVEALLPDALKMFQQKNPSAKLVASYRQHMTELGLALNKECPGPAPADVEA